MTVSKVRLATKLGAAMIVRYDKANFDCRAIAICGFVPRNWVDFFWQFKGFPQYRAQPGNRGGNDMPKYPNTFETREISDVNLDQLHAIHLTTGVCEVL